MDGKAYYEFTRQYALEVGLQAFVDLFFPPWDELDAQKKADWEQFAYEQECSDRGQPRLQEVDND